MKKILLGVIGAAACAAPAWAADLPPRPYTKAPAPPAVMAPIYNWTGFYIGGHVGGAWAGSDNLAASDGRFLGGIQGGADYQFAPNWVAGVEAQYSWLASANGSGVAFPPNGLATQATRGLGSATARLGWSWGPGLLYVKGGYAFRDDRLGVTAGGLPTTFTTTGNRDSGYTVGAGLEYMFAPNWSAKAEYQYYDFGKTTFTSPAALAGARFRNDDHTVKVGVNYRFGWGGSPGPNY
jgi:outer membrane immunogenic protein